MSTHTGTIQIHHEAIPFEEVADQILGIEAGTFETANGEITDAAARAIADHFSRNGDLLGALAGGVSVNRTALLDDISQTARAAMGRTHVGWPRELEHLSTWVINHD